MFDADKSRMIGEKTMTICYAVFIWYRNVKGGQTDRRTDRQTDRRTDLLYQYRASVCWRAIKTRIVWLPCGEKILKICLFVSTEYTNVTDRQTDRRTPHDGTAESQLTRVKFGVDHSCGVAGGRSARCWVSIAETRQTTLRIVGTQRIVSRLAPGRQRNNVS